MSAASCAPRLARSNEGPQAEALLDVPVRVELHAVAWATVHRETFVAWAWAVNGFCSVVSSVLATLLSMTIGFDGVMACGAGLYVVGILALRRLDRSTPAGR